MGRRKIKAKMWVVRVPLDLDREVNQAISSGIYGSKSNFIRYAIKRFIAEHAGEDSKTKLT